MAGCGRNHLLIDGPWKWMIQQFAVHFNVSVPYTLMAHLRWRGGGGAERGRAGRLGMYPDQRYLSQFSKSWSTWSFCFEVEVSACGRRRFPPFVFPPP